jgi:hypothetical protein
MSCYPSTDASKNVVNNMISLNTLPNSWMWVRNFLLDQFLNVLTALGDISSRPGDSGIFSGVLGKPGISGFFSGYSGVRSGR